MSQIFARGELVPAHDDVGGKDEKGSWTGLEVSAGPAREGTAAGAVLRRPVAPMLAAPVDAVPERPGLIHEPKWDGWRVIAFRGTDGVYLQSRAGRNLTTYFPNPRELHRMSSFHRELLVLEPTCDRLRPRPEGR
ncbi:hypothetical protein OG994_11440 [Micromonospora globbae]|uniref:ATP-dependent DNA ligase family profile domain-containing protein n=1 Tax=Micromonospora globbae TaxID=1894969 RepID=A0ABZ1SCV4_9ACTN|nr:hypothetical protein [Micromonospora globbae]